MPGLNAATYTHRLNYNHSDHQGTAELYAIVTFDDSSNLAYQNTSGLGASVDTGFTPSITFYYTPTQGGTTYTVSGSDITVYRLTLNNTGAGNTDYDGTPTLKSQISNIQFGTFGASGHAFSLTMNDDPFSLQADVSGEEFDFDLDTTVFPAPLPLLGLLPAFSSFRRLKKRYNSKTKS